MSRGRCPDCQEYIPTWGSRCPRCSSCEDCCRCPLDPDTELNGSDPDSMEDGDQPYFWNR